MRRFLLLMCLTAPSATPGSAAESALIHFEIQDQFDVMHTKAEFAGYPLVLFGSDRKGSRYSGVWVEAVRDAVARSGAVHMAEVADLRGVPFFLKGSVKKKFPRDPQGWVLLDWQGQMARAYEFEHDSCSILLFHRDGRLTYRAAVTELDEEILQQLLAHLEALSSGREESPRPERRD